MLATRTLSRPAFLGQETTAASAWVADRSWQRVSQICIGLQLLLFAVSLALYRTTGIDVLWTSNAGLLALTVALGGSWAILRLTPGRSMPRRRMAEAVAGIIVFLSLIQITAPMQYGAIALGRPFIDAWLDGADRFLGIDVPGLTAWTGQYPSLVVSLNFAYESLGPQLLIPLILLPIAGDRHGLWEYLWHLHVSLVGALICLALWPTVYVFTYRGFDPLVSPVMVERCMTQLWALHAGRFHTVALQDMQGLISFPSFHTAAAIAVTWALRRQSRWIWIPVALLNVGLVSATVLLGLHYVADLIGTAALLAASLVMYRWWLGPGAGAER